MRYFAWGLEILILAAGIHLFLRFVRTTRGNRLIRGLFLSVIVGVVGLWGFSRALGLEELEHLLRSSTGFIVVGFVVIFQSELRRGIAQLGEHSLVGRLMRSADAETIHQVVEAARSLAAIRRGALIVFERETHLHTVLETGTAVDAAVRASLLETLFHPETPLHDGAVIVRKDRVAAAGCILPLSEETLPSPTMGTRHRAGLGLSEESDALVLIVSEETGSLSLAKDGALHADLSPEELEHEITRRLEGRHEPGGEEIGLVHSVLRYLRRDLIWLPGSLLIALGIFYIAHQGLQETEEFRVRFVDGQRARDQGPHAEEVLVLLDRPGDRLVDNDQDYWVEVTGTRSEIEELGGAVRGILRVEQPDWEGGPVPIERIRWEDEGGLDYAWKIGTPALVVQRYESRSFQLTPAAVAIDESRLNPRLALARDQLRFEPSAAVQVSGPKTELDKLGRELELRLATIRAAPEDHLELRRRAELHPDLVERELVLSTEVAVVVPIHPVAREIGTVNLEIAQVCFDPRRMGELERWELPAHAQTARFSITTLGLIPEDADPTSPAMIERFGLLRRFVEENLRVFVDVSELAPDGEGRSVRVRWTWRRTWQEASEALTDGNLHEELDVVLLSDAEVLLEPRTPTGSVSARNANKSQ